jgi:dTDP-4-dehydrorhamnose 3,5-epimerase
MKVQSTQLMGLILIEPKRFGDHRGFFAETYSRRTYAALGVDVAFVQDNHSLSAGVGTVRGLHFQAPPHAQAKLVRRDFRCGGRYPSWQPNLWQIGGRHAER